MNIPKTRGRNHWLWCGVIAILAIVITSAESRSGTIRHDVTDSQYTSLAALPQYQSVGQILTNGRLGSGTLVAPGWVLTAAHVADEAVNLRFRIDSTIYNASNSVIHPLYDGVASKGYDIALVKLTAPVAGITPVQLYRGSSEIGAIGTSVGFGTTGTGLTGSTVMTTNKRAGQNNIDFSLNNIRVLTSDFDSPIGTPGHATHNLFNSATPLDLEYLVAPGDSGGGLFIHEAGVDYLAGVHSFGIPSDASKVSSYGDISGHTRVSSHSDWIDSYITAVPLPLAMWAAMPLLAVLFTRQSLRLRSRH